MGKSRVWKNLKMWFTTWNSTGDLPPFKKGVFYVAPQIQVPLIPKAYSTFYTPR